MSLPGSEQNVGIELGYIRLRIGLGEIGAVGDDVADILVDLLQLVLARPFLFENAGLYLLDRVMLERIFCTSSFERYFAGSDIEWPR